MENPKGAYAKLSPVDQKLFDSIVSAFPSDPLTDEEFEAAQHVSNTEHKLEDVIAWAKEHWDTQE
jgi:hypothetical protein